MALTSFFSALTGLNANSHTINTIGDNLANTNTIGFKAGKATFAEIIGGMSGFSATGNPIVFGQGAMLNGIAHKQTQGTPEYTGNSTDVMINGSGYFVVETGDGGIGYTRAGRFQFNSEGILVSSDGYKLMGYAMKNGKIDYDKMVSLDVKLGTTIDATPTSEMCAATNLDSRKAKDDDFATSIQVYDSLGAQHTIKLTFTKTNDAGAVPEWSLGVTLLDDTVQTTIVDAPLTNDVVDKTAAGYKPDDPSTWKLATDIWVLDPNAAPPELTQEVSLLDPDPNNWEIYDANGVSGFDETDDTTWPSPITSWLGPETVTLPATGTPIYGPYTLEFDDYGRLKTSMPDFITLDIPADAFGENLPASKIDLKFKDDYGNSLITSAAAASGTSFTSQDGYASSTLKSVAFDNNGILIGLAANGNSIKLGQLALATFPNVEGMQKYNGSTFIASPTAAGEASYGTANSSGKGSINGGSLEMSNVDMAEEFINLIIAQRAFQANARVITTSDELYQEAIHLKR